MIKIIKRGKKGGANLLARYFHSMRYLSTNSYLK